MKAIRVKESVTYLNFAYDNIGISFTFDLFKARIYKSTEEANLDIESIVKRLTGIQLEIIEIKQEII